MIYSGFSQTQTTSLKETRIFSNVSEVGGTTNITQDARLETTIHNHIKANKNRVIFGWRVQIYFGTGQSAKYQAENIKKKFLRNNPETRAYINYEAPFFKVRVGNYRTKFEAAKMKQKLETKYQKVFIVEEEIDIFNKNEEEENN